MSNKWLLVETFGLKSKPSIIAIGSVPKKMLAFDAVLHRGPNLDLVRQLVADATNGSPQKTVEARTASRRGIAVPLRAFTGLVHGAFVWVGGADDEPPQRDIAGAWHFNLTTDTIGGSDELLDLYGVRPEDRQTERATAEAFERLIPNADATAALALLVRSRPGDEHQAVWGVRRDDGVLRAGHLSCRAVAEEHGARPQVVLRGITHDIGPAEQTPAAPPPPVLEQRVLESMAEPGSYRALVNLKTLRILRWIDSPLPRLAWRHSPGASTPEPWIHPDDREIALKLSRDLKRGHSAGTVRLADSAGGWLPVHIVANIVLLDQHTTAGLFTMRLATTDEGQIPSI